MGSRKIVQRWFTEGIVSGSNDDCVVSNVDSYSYLFALCDDETLWCLKLFCGDSWTQVKVPPIPQPDEN